MLLGLYYYWFIDVLVYMFFDDEWMVVFEVDCIGYCYKNGWLL